MATYSCRVCGNVFQRANNQVYCSDVCTGVGTRHRKRNWKSVDKARNPIRYRLELSKTRARRFNVEFNLTEEWFLAHFSQGCELTGKELDLERGGPWSAEIDRIDPNAGYTMDNCRIVASIYNQAKMNWSDADVMSLALALTEGN